MPSYEQCILKLSEAERQANEGILKSIQDAPDKEIAIAEVVNKISRAKREAAMQAVVMKRRRNDLLMYQGGNEFDKLMALLTKDVRRGAPYANIEYRGRTYSRRFHAKMARMLKRFEKKNLGWTEDAPTMNKFIRAVYGEVTDDPEINAFAKDWHKLVDETVELKNKFGASISKNESFLLPQRHDARALLKLGATREEAKDAWVEMITPMLDKRKMLDDQGKPLTDQQLNETLQFVFDSIVTGGLNKLKEFQAPFANGRKLSRKGSDQRVLYFKDAENWIKYQTDFGRGDVFGTLTDFIESSANDIAQLELMGPNPNTTFEAFFAMAQRDGKLTAYQQRRLRDTWNVVSGKVNEGQPTGFSDFFQGYRNIDTAALLGSAVISALSDIGFQVITSMFNKIPTYKVLGRFLSQIATGEGDKRIAAQMGLGADAWIHTAHSSNRYADTYGVGFTSKLANSVMKLSLLEPWTNANRRAFGMEFSGAIAREFNTAWGDLDSGFRAMFERNGITESDWDAFRKTDVIEHEGAVFADFVADESMKFHTMVLQETDLAVPTPDARVRSILTMGQSRETVEGQFWRSAFAIKSFPITIATTHLQRGWYMASKKDKLSYFGMMFATTSVLGGIALQARDVAAGRDMRDIDEKFLVAAVSQGGGLGIFGDFVFNDVNRHGYSFAEQLAGPSFQTLTQLYRLGPGNVIEAISNDEANILDFFAGDASLRDVDEATKFTSEVGRAIDRFTPSIWQTKLFEQAIFNSYQELADPNFAEKKRKLLRTREKEYGQGYWWKPGEFAPERAPEAPEITFGE